MKKGMETGQTAVHEFRVTPDMFASFEGEMVHPAYSTVSMVYHMEWASRKIILPYLEDHEEGIGGSVKVKHIAPSGDGTQIKVTATLTKLEGNLVFTDVEAHNEAGIIGKGEVVQAILPKHVIQEKIKQSGV